MTGDSDIQNPQSGNKGGKGGKGGKGKNKNLKKKETQEGGDGDGQASTSRQPSTVQRDAISEGLGAMSIAGPPPDAGQAQAKSGGKKKTGKKEKAPDTLPKVSNIEQAFDKEDKLDEEAKKKKWSSKNTAEDAYAELGPLIGFKFDQGNRDALCLRPNFASGRVGESTRVTTNFFRMKIRGNDVYQYDIVFLRSDESAAVKIEQEEGRKFKRLAKRMSQRLLARFKETTGSAVFAGIATAYDNDRILIASNPLHNVPRPDGAIFNFSFIEGPNEAPQNIFVRIKPTVRVSLIFEQDMTSPSNIQQNRSILQVIDIIAKSHAFQNDIIYGSKIFLPAIDRPRISMETDKGPTPYEMAFGYHQSTQLCQAGVMQNIDRATAVLYKGGPLINTICQLADITQPDKNSRLNAKHHEAIKELTYLRFETTYRGFSSRHTLRSFTSTPANETFFTDSDGRKKSVGDYFQEHYALTLKYPNLPCVEYSAGRFIPIEYCSLLPDQRNQKKLRDELIRIVSKHTSSQKPFERCRAIGDIAKKISGQLSRNQFSIELNPQQVTVDSRILPSPTLAYGNKPQFSPQDPGSWDMREKKFLKANPLRKWACFSLLARKIDENVAGKFVASLKKNGQMLGMTIDNLCMPHAMIHPTKLNDKFKECVGKGLQLIVVFMPEDAALYSMVKSIGDKKLGVPTQVVLDKHYDMRKPRNKLFDTAYLCNLLLKINMKIGGTNLKLNDHHRCDLLNEKTMVVGIDVNHPSPGENSPSIAAVVGSIDKEFSQYRTEVQVNSSRDEIVRVDEMITPILKVFKSRREFYPEHIIVYRDGVSEGQFTQVMAREILPLHQKLQTLPRPPQLTYMVVQKRHNARFFPTDRNKSTKSGNLLPGSVIDTDVCHFKWFDFYLCSQNSFLGTARPGKYTVLWNSSGALADDLQIATYYLCYLFARATKSIADPAPARYAHHAAARGKVHLQEILRGQGARGDREVNRQLANVINVVDNLKQILYFI